jgi:hypothetical protein
MRQLVRDANGLTGFTPTTSEVSTPALASPLPPPPPPPCCLSNSTAAPNRGGNPGKSSSSQALIVTVRSKSKSRALRGYRCLWLPRDAHVAECVFVGLDDHTAAHMEAPKDVVALFHSAFHPTRGNIVDFSLKVRDGQHKYTKFIFHYANEMASRCKSGRCRV